MSGVMKVVRADRDGIAVLRLEGEFDTLDTELIAVEFEACLREERYRILMDLEALTFINSSTIAWLISAQKTLRGHNGEMAFAAPAPFISNVLSTLGLHQIFQICDTVEAGTKALREGT